MNAEKRPAEVVVITGASAGVGRATARAFAERGARVGLLARGQDGLNGAVSDVNNRRGRRLHPPPDAASSLFAAGFRTALGAFWL